jgi:hypothetical protein
MAKFRLEDLAVGEKDEVGLPVVCVYALNKPIYAVYRNDRRVMIQFADADVEAGKLEQWQRAQLAPLTPLRGRINGLIDFWRDEGDAFQRAKVERFDRRVADALIVALEGNAVHARALLIAILDDIMADRRTKARYWYLAMAGSVMLATYAAVGIFWFLSQAVCWNSCPPRLLSSETANISNAVLGGALGAFFSISTALHRRTLRTDLHMRSNLLDAILRMIVGILSAAVLIMLMASNLVTAFSLGRTSIEVSTGSNWMLFFIIGFIGGFSERLVADLLAKSTLGGSPAEQSKAEAEALTPESTVAPQPKPQPPGMDGGMPAATGDVPDEEEECLCDAPASPGEPETGDHELPPATGGVSASAAKAA